MGQTFLDKKSRLLEEVASLKKIRAIGQTSDIKSVPAAGESDIDIFVFCDEIPNAEARAAAYHPCSEIYQNCAMTVCEGGVWGTGDIFTIDGIETMLMYFTIKDTLAYMNEVLDGKHLVRENGFYPVGRLSTLKNIYILYDEAYILHAIKEKLSVYPDELKKQMAGFHLGKTLDEEDLSRAVRRMDVLFYHKVLEDAIDHYLQALYAINGTFFPSRKRTCQYMETFTRIPENCYARLLEVIRLGTSPETIAESCKAFRDLVVELKEIYG